MSLSSLISFGNLLLGLAVVASFFLENWWQKILVFVVAGFFVKFYPGFDLSLFLFILSAAFGAWLADFLRNRTSANFIISVIVAEIVFNVLIAL
ncbi:MAG: hypothetical protein M1586_01195 [Patescibacteria group bacterium]|nr:hypothetical protein [Patescibacteria group bacterium]MCL5261902.1 hypothetical protein [Patescibacteria group bacterium]